MTSHQKFIKYLATTLAVLLIVCIIGGVVTGIMFLTGAFPGSSKPAPVATNVPYGEEPLPGIEPRDDDKRASSSGHNSKESHASEDFGDSLGNFISGVVDTAISAGDVVISNVNGDTVNVTAEDFTSRNYIFHDIENISVDASIYSIYFIQGTGKDVEVELTNVYKDYIVEQKNHTLSLEEPDVHFNNFGLNRLFDLLDNAGREKKASIQITLPEGFIAHEIELDGGVGDIELEKVTTRSLDIDAGVGNIEGFQVTADSVDIDGGTGNIEFTSSAFGDTDIDSGVGNVVFSGTLHGRVSVDCGVGNTKFSLSDSRSNYQLSLEKGLGNIKLNGNKIKFDDTYTENSGAPYYLDITGGVGDVTIDFAD